MILDDIQCKVRKYNPEKEIVLVFNEFVDRSMTALQPSAPDGMPPPPVAYRQLFGVSSQQVIDRSIHERTWSSDPGRST